MNFLKTWAHEIVIGAGGLWIALGTEGQNGLLNFARNAIIHSHWGPWFAAIVATGSIIIARLRQVPASQ